MPSSSLNTYSNTVSPAQRALSAVKSGVSSLVPFLNPAKKVEKQSTNIGQNLASTQSRYGENPEKTADYATPQSTTAGLITAPKNTGLITAPTPNHTPTPTPTPPIAPPIASASSQTIDPASAARAVYQAGQATPLEQSAIKRVSEAQGISNIGGLAPYAESQFYGGPGQPITPDLTRPDLAGRDAGTQGLYGKLSNIFGSQAQQELTAANTIAGRGLTGSTAVLNASLPDQISPGNTAYNPLTGTNIPGIGGNAFQGGVQQGNVTLGQNYAQNLSSAQQATGIKNSIQQYLTANPSLNPSSFTDVNTALQFLSGKTSDPRYQTLSNYLSEYISTLAPILGVGGDTTNLKTEIAQGMVNGGASGASIAQVLNNIEDLAKVKLEAAKNAGTGNTSTTSSSGGSTGGFAEAW